MKLLMIGWGLPQNTSGGMDTYCRNICAEMSKEHEVYLTIPKFNLPDEIEDMGNVCLVPIDSEKKKDMVETVLEYNKKIVEAFSEEVFDIVHVNDWLGVMAANRLKECVKTPFVFTIHSLEYMRRGTDRREKCDLDFLEHMGIRNSDAIITVSKLMKKEIAEKFDVKPEKIHAVHNGFLVPETPGDSGYIRKKHKTGNDRIVLYIGRLQKQKGVEYFIKAAGEILKERQDTTFVIAGFGIFEKSLKKFSDMMKLGNKTVFAGKIANEELLPYYASADVFVSPSLWEPFGLTITEAMSQKVPVVATDMAGAVEYMEDGKDVIRVKARSSDAIASAVIKLLNDEKLAKEIGNKGFEYCKKNFSWKKCAEKTLEVYKSIQGLNLNL
ncbi:MAG: glycosyltransferase family 4 protein [Candidatus Aenigmarchaeota archaeon]|nr:glycosyltransferase family 4 protein [Candidatus Aenigmarchaeota archaeon]